MRVGFVGVGVMGAPIARRQLVEAFRDDSVPRFLLPYRDAIYGEEFARRRYCLALGAQMGPRSH